MSQLPKKPRLPYPEGAPTTYDPIIAKKMCEQLADGIPLREICRQDGYPLWRVVYDWMYRDPELVTAIAYARDIGWDAIAEDCFRIADTPLLGEIVTDDGEKVTIRKEDMLGHRKLQVETRLKLLAKFNPKKYGDRVVHAGDAENPVVIENNINEFTEIVKNMKLKRQEKK
jgi:hypothetical protein